jgi:hypothetical protein
MLLDRVEERASSLCLYLIDEILSYSFKEAFYLVCTFSFSLRS